MNSPTLSAFELQSVIDQLREDIWKRSLFIIWLELQTALQGFIVLAVTLFLGYEFLAPIGLALILWSIYGICKVFDDFEPHFP